MPLLIIACIAPRYQHNATSMALASSAEGSLEISGFCVCVAPVLFLTLTMKLSLLYKVNTEYTVI